MLVAAARALLAVVRTLVLDLDAARLLLLPAASARASAEGQVALLATGGSGAGEILGRGGLHARRRGLLLRFVSAAALVVEAEALAVLGRACAKDATAPPPPAPDAEPTSARLRALRRAALPIADSDWP